VNAAADLDGAILAAGEGSRLRADGWAMPKPMVPVAGVPLIEHVLANFVAAGVTSLVVIVNESMGNCQAWVRQRFPQLDVRIIVKTTASSLESFREVLARADRASTLVSTVDAWCRPRDFVAFADAARRFPEGSLVLAVTSLVADERPLWVTLAPDGRVTRLGAESGAFVTAGLYLVPERLRRAAIPPGLGRLRDLLAWLVRRGEPVFGIPVPDVVDVDRAEDVALAEAMAGEGVPPAAVVTPAAVERPAAVETAVERGKQE
jgi:NDP-sugar pyrophosphorylase family protein